MYNGMRIEDLGKDIIEIFGFEINVVVVTKFNLVFLLCVPCRSPSVTQSQFIFRDAVPRNQGARGIASSPGCPSCNAETL